ncbi:MAG: hypothetical protein IPJ89_00130 [Candidatus Iainarchaeum archaeon]|uniref:Uncharacterized protein n=1 Tax=Candidatus Iainarchaeum sp. TaxID=3101447 RepID=A0A7T9DJZ4_9ARCH|nr:MAG: hypothetical protein IPJ89_00130 [Candidatus Diapherotrites archaeon]
MRGFIFSLDMVFAAVVIMAALVLIGFALQHAPGSPSIASADLALHAKDNALMRAFGGGATPPVPLTADAFACATAFKRVSTTMMQDPSSIGSWTITKSCAVGP